MNGFLIFATLLATRKLFPFHYDIKPIFNILHSQLDTFQ